MMADLFDNLPTRIVPQTTREWQELHLLLGNTFTPHRPINDRELFVGRIDLIGKVIDAVNEGGKHVVLYGDRGVGKSSLANSIKSTIQNVSRNTIIEKRSCTIEHDFSMIWHNLLDDFHVDGKPAREILPKTRTHMMFIDLFKMSRSARSLSLLSTNLTESPMGVPNCF